MRFAVVALFLLACGDNVRGNITITVTGELAPAVTELAAQTPYPIEVATTADDDGGFNISVIQDPSLPAQAFQLLRRSDRELSVIAPDVLGAQYGTTAALEALGFRFRHPYDTFVPRAPELVETIDDAVHTPDVRVRGLQLHTLHPMEAYFAFWEPSAGSRADAHRIIDWVVKNRGNYLQWVALEDIILDAEVHAVWKEFTAELIEYAHLRGVRVGLNIQLFGAANLQLAFDLVDDAEAPVAPQIAERLPLITDGLPFDVYDLSFGEFFNSDPQAFIDAVNEVHAQLKVLAPQAEMHALIHVGAEQRVEFNGETLLYYFLVKFANPEIIPDVHTVMFYNLFEPTGGAYQHEDFSEHREFLLERMCSGRPHAYQPETSYWVAFDNSVPQYFPLYVHNRWLDLEELANQPGCGPLDNHMLFSTGWEWGYWLHDATALRASYERPADPRALVEEQFGEDLAPAVDPVMRLIALQRERLMLGELVQYIAGRDLAIDAGRTLDPPIVSQPDRVTFADLIRGGDRVAFETEVIQPLEAYAAELEVIVKEVEQLALPDTIWGRELRAGFVIDRIRVAFILELYRATLAHLAGADGEVHLAKAEALRAQGQAIVSERHADLHDVRGARLVEKTSNKTFYQFGYLYMADTLCYWDREIVEVNNFLTSTSTPVPACLF